MDNPCFHIFGHPTGRIINKRPPYQFDMDKILEKAKERKVCLEINAQPQRLDLNEFYVRKAKDLGVKLVISTDAHSIQGLANMKYGVNQARRGWLGAKDVLNTIELKLLLKYLKSK